MRIKINAGDYTQFQFNIRAVIKYINYTFLIFAFGLVINALGIAQNRGNSGGMTLSGLAAGAPAGSYSLSEFENINLFSGNFNFNLPLVTIGGRRWVAGPINISSEGSVKNRTENKNLYLDKGWHLFFPSKNSQSHLIKGLARSFVREKDKNKEK